MPWSAAAATAGLQGAPALPSRAAAGWRRRRAAGRGAACSAAGACGGGCGGVQSRGPEPAQLGNVHRAAGGRLSAAVPGKLGVCCAGVVYAAAHHTGCCAGMHMPSDHTALQLLPSAIVVAPAGVDRPGAGPGRRLCGHTFLYLLRLIGRHARHPPRLCHRALGPRLSAPLWCAWGDSLRRAAATGALPSCGPLLAAPPAPDAAAWAPFNGLRPPAPPRLLLSAAHSPSKRCLSTTQGRS